MRVVIEGARGLEMARGRVLDTPHDAARVLAPFLDEARPAERLAVALLDAQRRLLAVALLDGAWRGCCVRPSEVCAPALMAGAAGVYLAHRHPAPALWALAADCCSLTLLWEMSRALGVQVHDHLIFDAEGRYASLHASRRVWSGHPFRGLGVRLPLPEFPPEVEHAPRTRSPALPASRARDGCAQRQGPGVSLWGLRARLVHEKRRVPPDGRRTARTHADVAPLLASVVTPDRGEIVAGLVNRQQRVFAVALVTAEVSGSGCCTCEAVSPEAVYRAVVACGAHAVYVAHAHATDEPHVAEADRSWTARVYALGCELGLELRDHLIFGLDGRHLSLRERREGSTDWCLGDDPTVKPQGMRLHQATSNRLPQHPGTRHARSARAALRHCMACGRLSNKKRVCRYCGSLRRDCPRMAK